MDHNQAVTQMAAERYLLNELPAEVRDAFEEHVFDCHECAMDLRAGAAFVDVAKAQLPELVMAPPVVQQRPKAKRGWWFEGWRPVFVVPAFAALLLALGYQDLVTMPALRNQAAQPRILAMTTLHGATRGGAAPTISADPAQGVAIAIDLSQGPGNESGSSPYVSYSVDLLDAQGNRVWTSTIAAAGATTRNQDDNQRVMLAIPGQMLHNGSHTVAITGIGAKGERTALDRYAFNVALTH